MATFEALVATLATAKKIGNTGKALHDTGFKRLVTTASCLIDNGTGIILSKYL